MIAQPTTPFLLTFFRGFKAAGAAPVRFARFLAIAFLFPLVAINGYTLQKGFVGMEFADLMKVKVSSVERREKEIGQTPAAIFVVRSEDIRRSGATSVPELLRGVPGISVARVNGNNWAISARGGQSTLANKLLVLIDGRSVYTPLFAGVFWDVQDIPLESIDRIEVIRGPGGSVWGANAVNGVINIIRKTPADSRGTLVSLGAGTEERVNGNVITGWKVGERTAASVYGRYREFDDLRLRMGGDAGDQGHQGGGGFRVDGAAGQSSKWSVSGDGYSGQFYENRLNPVLTPVPATLSVHDETTVSGLNVMSNFSHKFDRAGILSLQSYYDRTERRIPQIFSEVRDTVDVTAQHQVALTRVHLVSYGSGFRMTTDRVANSLGARFEPDQATDNIINVFVQDEIRFTPAWSVNVGTKFERNDYTGWEVQPSLRTAWEFMKDNILWAAVSRAVRTPTRLDRDVKLQSIVATAPATLLSAQGNDGFVSERLTAYELGYRAQPAANLYVGVAGFYNVYDHLRGASLQPAYLETDPTPAHFILPLVIDNDLRGETYGVEFIPRVKVTESWQLRGSYSYLHQRLHVVGGEPDVVAASEVTDPVHQAYLRSSWNIGTRVELDAGARWVGKVNGGVVDDYATADARAAWKARENLMLELIGQNVLERSHVEFTGGNEVERSVFGKATWRFE